MLSTLRSVCLLTHSGLSTGKVSSGNDFVQAVHVDASLLGGSGAVLPASFRQGSPGTDAAMAQIPLHSESFLWAGLLLPIMLRDMDKVQSSNEAKTPQETSGDPL